MRSLCASVERTLRAHVAFVRRWNELEKKTKRRFAFCILIEKSAPWDDGTMRESVA